MPEVVGGVSVALLRRDGPDRRPGRARSRSTCRGHREEARRASCCGCTWPTCTTSAASTTEAATAVPRGAGEGAEQRRGAEQPRLAAGAPRDGDAEEALELHQQGDHRHGPAAPTCWTRAAWCTWRLKDTAKALADLKEATAEAPTPARLYHLAQAYHEDRDAATRPARRSSRPRRRGWRSRSCTPSSRRPAGSCSRSTRLALSELRVSRGPQAKHGADSARSARGQRSH